MKKFNLIGSIIEVHFLDPWNLLTTLTGVRSSEFLSPQTPPYTETVLSLVSDLSHAITGSNVADNWEPAGVIYTPGL